MTDKVNVTGAQVKNYDNILDDNHMIQIAEKYKDKPVIYARWPHFGILNYINSRRIFLDNKYIDPNIIMLRTKEK